MGNPAQMQTQATPPAFPHAGAMKAKHRTGKDRDLPMCPPPPDKTCGLTPQVSLPATSQTPSPNDCTTEQLFEIVIDVARRFRTAKEVVAEHRDYILRLKIDVFKVRFGSLGVRVPVTWKEFCESHFGVTADWINRICGGKAEGPGQEDKGDPAPDWKNVLAKLISALEQCGDSLPLLAKDALHDAQGALEGNQASNPDQMAGGRTGSKLVVARADARHIPLPSNSVQCVITSPPYWGLRRYAGNQEVVWGGAAGCGHQWDDSLTPTHGTCLHCGGWRGSFGLEPTVEMYVEHTVEVLREVRRVLRPDGVVFWNVGDSYSGSGKGIGGDHGKAIFTDAEIEKTNWKDSGLKPKDLCLMPQRIALAAQDDGWWVRSDIIWAKSNPMPESVTDRPTDAYEHILMLTKSERYYWNAKAVREKGCGYGRSERFRASSYTNNRSFNNSDKDPNAKGGGKSLKDCTDRNLRNVWTFATQPYKGAHFATFPDKLPLNCIRAACPDQGCCRFCRTPWKWVTMVGWTPGCKCRGQHGITKACLVLDIFGGAGTTGLAATELKQDCVLLDISTDYVQMMMERLKGKSADAPTAGVDRRNHGGMGDRPLSVQMETWGLAPPLQGPPAQDAIVEG